MRIKIKFSKNIDKVPNNQSLVNSYIHRCLGDNEYHDSPSNYCISRLSGGLLTDGGKSFDFPNGGFIIITSVDISFIDKIILGVVKNPKFGFGMEYDDIEFIQENVFDGYNHFKTMDNGFILKSITGDCEYKYHTLEDDDFAQVLTNHIINKFKKIDATLDFGNFRVEIPNHKSHKVRNIYVKNVKNVSNVCQFTLYSNKRVAQAIYDYGVGQSTGSGFGTIYKTENINAYR